MTAKDTFDNVMTAKDSPGDDIFPITPHDTNELSQVTRGIVFVTAGVLKVKTLEGNVRTLPDGLLAAGMIHPLRVRMVYATDTTAADIYGVV